MGTNDTNRIQFMDSIRVIRAFIRVISVELMNFYGKTNH